MESESGPDSQSSCETSLRGTEVEHSENGASGFITSSDSGLRPELRVLLACSKVAMDPGDVQFCKRLIADSEDFDWGDLLASAWRQKVLPLVGRNLEIHGIVGGDGWPFVAAYLGNRVRTGSMLHELDRLLVHLRDREIPVIVRKGP